MHLTRVLNLQKDNRAGANRHLPDKQLVIRQPTALIVQLPKMIFHSIFLLLGMSKQYQQSHDDLIFFQPFFK